MIKRDDFLKALTVKSEVIALDTLNGAEIEIKQYTINEFEKVEEVRLKVINQEVDYMELVKIGCKYAMLNPTFFTDEEIEQFGQQAIPVMLEIFSKIPTIGMTDEQKANHKKALEENIQKEIKKLSKEEIEKKSSKK